MYSEISSAVERFSYTEDVTGSNPVFRTMAIDVIELVVDEVSKYMVVDNKLKSEYKLTYYLLLAFDDELSYSEADFIDTMRCHCRIPSIWD